MYDWFPNSITSIFFPVNESIWEHMKIIFSSTIIVSFIEYMWIKKTGLLYHNFWFYNIFFAFLSIPVYLTVFVPIYNVIGENFIFSISLMLAVIIFVVLMIDYYKKKEIKDLTFISLSFLSLCYILFGYLTYYPVYNELFYDTLNNMYGINTYLLRD